MEELLRELWGQVSDHQVDCPQSVVSQELEHKIRQALGLSRHAEPEPTAGPTPRVTREMLDAAARAAGVEILKYSGGPWGYRYPDQPWQRGEWTHPKQLALLEALAVVGPPDKRRV